MNKPKKQIYVVILSDLKRRNETKEKKIVRAKDEGGAIRTAKRHSFAFGGRRSFVKCVYVASPIADLACTTEEQHEKLMCNLRQGVHEKNQRLATAK